MTASVASFLTQAQKKGAELPPALSGALLLAAVRLSDKQGQAVRPYQLLVDDDGALELLAGEAPASDAYAAPELRNGAALGDDARVLVFAAGALGYELITLAPPKMGEEAPGAELKGPLAPIVRKALAERQHRFRNLRDMARAIEAVAGRPTREEERLILAAVAASTPLPPAQKLAKLELTKGVAPEVPPPREERAAPSQAVFTQVWDPLEQQAAQREPEPPPAQEKPAKAPAPEILEEERKQREALAAAVDSGKRDLAELGTRISMVEEQIRSTVPPPVSGTAALVRDVKQLIDRRSFGEAERALQDSAVANDAVLQLLLGQALSGGSGADPKRLERATAAFRRAAELDPAWAQARALLGGALWRQGKRAEARAEFRAALEIDPACPEAIAATASPRPPVGVAAIAAAAGALVAVAVMLAARPAAAPRDPRPAVAAMVPAPPPPPVPAAQPVPETKPHLPVAEAKPEALPADVKPAPVARRPAPELPALPPPQRQPAPAKTARAEPKRKSGARSAAEAEAAKGDKALRAFDTKSAQAAFASALQLDPSLPSAHRGMGMVYVLLGRNAEAKAEYSRYLELAPDAPDKEQIARVLAR